MKRRTLIKRRDGIRQHYHVRRGGTWRSHRTKKRCPVCHELYWHQHTCQRFKPILNITLRRQIRRSRKIDKERYDELNKMDPFPSHMVARGTDLVVVDTREASEEFRKDINYELEGANKSISLFEEPDAPAVVHVVGRKNKELFEEVVDLTEPDARAKQNKFIEEIML